MTIRDEVLLPHPRAAGAVQSMNADYYRYVSYLDTQLGRILEALDATPLAKNTIIVFSSDSGVARGSHGLIGKQNLYEHSIRVPLIFAGPGIAANRSTDAMCYLFDLMPTLGALCGVSPPPPSEGKDLSRILRDASGEGRSALMFAYRDVQRACRNDRWKLIRYPQIDKTQLFDLRSDPDERENLADRPEHASKASELMTLLEKEMKAAGDSAPLTVSNPKPADWSPTPRKKK
jgi:arylsulfatase A-like enzyme